MEEEDPKVNFTLWDVSGGQFDVVGPALLSVIWDVYDSVKGVCMCMCT